MKLRREELGIGYETGILWEEELSEIWVSCWKTVKYLYVNEQAETKPPGIRKCHKNPPPGK